MSAQCLLGIIDVGIYLCIGKSIFGLDRCGQNKKGLVHPDEFDTFIFASLRLLDDAFFLIGAIELFF